MTLQKSASFATALTAAFVVVLSWTPAARQARPDGPKSSVPTVSLAGLREMLPVLEGWTQTRVNAERVDREAECTYAFAEGVYVNGEMKIRVTVADTARTPDAVMALASLTRMFPDGYVGTVPPSTSIQRLTYRTFPAATMWDAVKGEGEFTVLVGGRFVAKAETPHADSLDTLRAAIDKIDLTQFDTLK
jgi:hypothetical protein